MEKRSSKKKAAAPVDDPLAGNLAGYLSQLKWRKVKFTFAAKDTTVTLRVPKALVATAKQIAKKRGIKYQSMMRDAIVNCVVKAA